MPLAVDLSNLPPSQVKLWPPPMGQRECRFLVEIETREDFLRNEALRRGDRLRHTAGTSEVPSGSRGHGRFHEGPTESVRSRSVGQERRLPQVAILDVVAR